MAVTVGRLEYIIGADGRVIERESRAAAKKAGKKSGADLNDSMIESFRRKWGGPSGFAATLSKQDQRIVAHFNKLGLFSSKAYADRFEKSLRPRYQATVKRMIAEFNRLTANGTIIDLTRNFKNGPQLEGQLTRIRDVMEELQFALTHGLGDKPAGFDVGPLNRYIAALKEAKETGELDPRAAKKQQEINEAVLEGVGAIDKLVAAQDRRARFLEGGETDEAENWLDTARLLTIYNKLLAENAEIGTWRVRNHEEILQKAREELVVEQEMEKLQIRERRLAIDANNQAMIKNDLIEAEARAKKVVIEQDRELAEAAGRERGRLAALRGTLDALAGRVLGLTDKQLDLVNAYKAELEANGERIRLNKKTIEQLTQTYDLLGKNATIEKVVLAMRADQIAAARDLADAEEQLAAKRIRRLEVDEADTRAKMANKKIVQEEKKAIRDQLESQNELLQADRAALELQLQKLTKGKELDKLNKKRRAEADALVAALAVEEEKRLKLAKAIDSNARSIRSNDQWLNTWLQTLRQNRIEMADAQALYDQAVNKWHDLETATKRATKVQAQLTRAIQGQIPTLQESNEEYDKLAETLRNTNTFEEKLGHTEDERRATMLKTIEALGERIGFDKERLGLMLQEIELADDLDSAMKNVLATMKATKPAAEEQVQVEETLVKSKKKLAKATEDTNRVTDEHLHKLDILASFTQDLGDTEDKRTRNLMRLVQALGLNVDLEEKHLQTIRQSLKSAPNLQSALLDIVHVLKLWNPALVLAARSTKDLDAETQRLWATTDSVKSVTSDQIGLHGELAKVHDDAVESLQKMAGAEEELSHWQQLKNARYSRAIDKGKKAVKANTEEAESLLALKVAEQEKAESSEKLIGTADKVDAAVRKSVETSKIKVQAEQDVEKAIEKHVTAVGTEVTALKTETRTTRKKITAVAGLSEALDTTTGSEKKLTAAQVEANEKTRLFEEAILHVREAIGDNAAWKRLVRQFGGVGNATDEVRRRLEELTERGTGNPKLAATLEGFTRRLLNYQDAAREAANRTNTSTRAVRVHTSAVESGAQAQARMERELRKTAEAEGISLKVRRETVQVTQQQHDEIMHLVRAGDTFADALKRVTGGMRAFGGATDDSEKKGRPFGKLIDYLGGKLKNLGKSSDLNARAIVGIIAALGEPIAVLGGAIGPALLAVGSAAAAGVLGVGALVTAFSVLGEDIENLPEDLQDVATEFGGLKGALSALRFNIAAAAFSEMDGAFESLTTSVVTLTPAFQRLGGSAGKVVDTFARNTAQGTQGFAEIEDLVERSGPMFEDLADSVGRFTLALLVGFRRAQPMTDDFLEWLDDLSTTFLRFVNGPTFDDWLGHGMTIFRSLGGLVDALGKSLNELVTDESVKRTADFIDNLTRFMPHLEDIIAMFGELDILGLVSQLLADFGDALQPLEGPLDDLAGAINDLIGGALDGLSVVLRGVAEVLGPVIEGLALLLNVIPPEGWALLAGGVAAFGASLALIAGVKGLLRLPGLLRAIGAAAEGMIAKVLGAGAAAKTASKGFGLLNKALVGVALVGLGFDALDSWFDKLDKTDDQLVDTIKTAGTSRQALEAIGKPLETKWWGDIDTSAHGVKDALNSSKVAAEGFFGAMSQSLEQKGTLDVIEQFGEGLGVLATTDLPGATAAFQKFVTENKLSNEQIDIALGHMTPYTDALIAASDGALVAGDAEGIRKAALDGVKIAQDTATEDLKVYKTTLQLTKESLVDLADEIRSFGDEFLNQRGSARDYQDAIADVNEALKENGVTLDITKEKGRANEAALDALGQASQDYVADTLIQTKSQEEANKVIQKARTDLINTAKGFGMTADEAVTYANKLGLIPLNIVTKVSADTAAAQQGIDSFVRTNNGKTIRIYVDGSFDTGVGTIKGNAAGGTFTRPTIGLFGEAGPEAIVPLNRPLSRVDPSVRALSAIAQGLSQAPRLAGSNTLGSGKSVNISPGAITIQGDMQPEATATRVVNRIAERFAG